MRVFVHSYVRRVQICEQNVKQFVQGLLSDLRAHSSEVSITFIGDARMRRLNREYRGKDHTTDVLAFASREAPLPSTPMLGDVVVSLPRAMAQAKSLHHSLNEEIARLLIHGVLHLLGYDHERNEREAQRMGRRERELWSASHPCPRLVRSIQ